MPGDEPAGANATLPDVRYHVSCIMTGEWEEKKKKKGEFRLFRTEQLDPAVECLVA